jgi:hypothetical protein
VAYDREIPEDRVPLLRQVVDQYAAQEDRQTEAKDKPKALGQDT